MTDPKPCPFCGEDELLTELKWVDSDTPERWNFKRWVVSCANTCCYVQPSVWGVENWNKLSAIGDSLSPAEAEGLLPKGYVVVPEEPTMEMCRAAGAEDDWQAEEIGLSWSTMIDARPKGGEE